MYIKNKKIFYALTESFTILPISRFEKIKLIKRSLYEKRSAGGGVYVTFK